jgi:hypothetical protein
MLPDQLTIRVESTTEFVDLDHFVSVVENTLAILADIEVSIGQYARRRIHWRISSVSLNSPLMVTVFPDTEEDDPEFGRQLLVTYTRGLRQIEESCEVRPSHFSDDALEAAKKLVAPLNSGMRRITFVTTVDEPVSPTQRAAANVDSILPKEHTELGSIEGYLESISVHKERVFAIWEVFSSLRVECRFSLDQLEEAKAALSQRVAVTGTIRYDRRSRPVSISHITRIRVLRPQKDLPQARDLEGIRVVAGGPEDEL